ncbi:phage lysis protein LysC [Escherichia coli]|nr:phage lysis protein LysC [Escherichia coli]
MKTKIFAAGYGAELPDAVRRLHQRPACTDASDCPQRLPESEPLPDAGSDPQTNGDLSADIRQLENALARCASQVKMIKHCQDENDAQTRQPAQGAD